MIYTLTEKKRIELKFLSELFPIENVAKLVF